MKTKKFLSILLTALMMFTSLFVNVSVSAEASEITYKVIIDGTEVTVGSYTEGSTVALPVSDIPDGKIFVGYKSAEGTVLTEAVVTSEILEYTSVLRNIPQGDYINERGNLANVKAKIDAGKLNVVFLGGSVTSGAKSTGRGRWASRVIDYLRAEYPDAEINDINVGIGGTGSRLGAFRLAEDVIAQDPDLVFVDSVMNDAYNGEYTGNVYRGKYYEYIIRTIRTEVPDAEIISLAITNATNAKAYGFGTMHPIAFEQDKIAANYDVATIDMGRYMLESIFDTDKQYDENIWGIYIADSVHPNNLGYGIYAEIINSYLDGIKTATGETTTYTVPETYVYPAANGFIPTTIPLTLDGTTINPVLKNVTGFTLAKRTGTPAYPYYLVPEAEASFEFEFEGTELALYMNSPNEGSTIKVTVDGVAKSVDGQDDTNGPKEFFDKLENTTHTAKVELSGITTEGNIIGILVGVDTIAPEPIDPSEIDCVIKTAEDIVADGVLTGIIDNATTSTQLKAGNIELKGLVDGMARFGAKDSKINATGTKNDRALISVDDVVFAEYPYCVMVYKTNIPAEQLNFNFTTKDAIPSGSGDHKKFNKQNRVAGELATAVAGWNVNGYGTEGKITGIYVPIYNTATDTTMSASHYFDVQYVGFFKNEDDADAFDYDAYLESLEEDEVIYGDVNADGTVDRKDLTRLAQYFARWSVEIDAVASDANGDGTVDRKDLTRLAQYFARWEVTLGK